jgi:hypothetical protein
MITEGLLPLGSWVLDVHEPQEGARVSQYATPTHEAFESSHTVFVALIEDLTGPQRGHDTHAELEHLLTQRSRELTRQLLQDCLDLRAAREQRHTGITGADGIRRTRVEHGHTRTLATVFGQVTVPRLAYRAPSASNLHPADARLNLPATKHSHGLRRLAAIEATRGSFDSAVTAIGRATGVRLGKRQVEQLTTAAAVDIDSFYAQRCRPAGGHEDLLVLSYDGKGVVMRPDALRPATAHKAATGKLATRLSPGEKRNRKRMAEVGVVYEASPTRRAPGDILPVSDQHRVAARPGPRATRTWLTASLLQDTAHVVAVVFDEAHRRDPDHQRRWVVLVDGNTHQIDRTHAEAAARGVDVAIVVDFIHVLEYLWTAAWSFFHTGDPTAETWVRHHALRVLQGEATAVAGLIRRTASIARLDTAQRKGVDTCAGYLLSKAPYLDYPTALAEGWPIATGVIEGACRFLVKDRMDITGARWGLPGAEAVLTLRALHANGDFDEYWSYHLAQEQGRVHQSRYLNNTVPRAA